MKYKVGDTVKTTRLSDCLGTPLFPVGSIGIVTRVSTNAGDVLPYEVSVTGYDTTFWYSEDDIEPYESKTYEQGLADAWELAKKLVCPERQGGLDAVCFANVFGELTDVEDVFFEYTYEDCRDKIEAYKKENFKVGDEVTMLDQYDRPIKGCVVGFFTENLLYVADKDGGIEEWGRDKLTKTGVHYDEIESVFKRLDDDYER